MIVIITSWLLWLGNDNDNKKSECYTSCSSGRNLKEPDFCRMRRLKENIYYPSLPWMACECNMILVSIYHTCVNESNVYARTGLKHSPSGRPRVRITRFGVQFARHAVLQRAPLYASNIYPVYFNTKDIKQQTCVELSKMNRYPTAVWNSMKKPNNHVTPSRGRRATMLLRPLDLLKSA